LLKLAKEIYLTMGGWAIVFFFLVMAGMGIYLAIRAIKEALKKKKEDE